MCRTSPEFCVRRERSTTRTCETVDHPSSVRFSHANRKFVIPWPLSLAGSSRSGGGCGLPRPSLQSRSRPKTSWPGMSKRRPLFTNSTSPRGTEAVAISRSYVTCFGSGSPRMKSGHSSPAAASSTRTADHISTSRLPMRKGGSFSTHPLRVDWKHSPDRLGIVRRLNGYSHAIGLHIIAPLPQKIAGQR